MINIRNNLFETNSSSVHAICRSKNNDWEIPNTLHFDFGEYGWENRVLATTYELASYLYTALCSIYEDKELSDYKNYIYDTLGRHRCECTFAEPSTVEWGYFNSGYVDHSVEKDRWDELYMGDEGQYTFFIDAVNQKFAVSSLSEEQYDLMDNVDDMFRYVNRGK